MFMTIDRIDEESAQGSEDWHPADLFIQALAAYKYGDFQITQDDEVVLKQHLRECTGACPKSYEVALRIQRTPMKLTHAKFLAGKGTALRD